jgi:hypothetical protein
LGLLFLLYNNFIQFLCNFYCWPVAVFAGYGVFAAKSFKKGGFILEYAGALIGEDEGDLKPDQTYIYYFIAGGKKYWYASFVFHAVDFNLETSVDDYVDLSDACAVQNYPVPICPRLLLWLVITHCT